MSFVLGQWSRRMAFALVAIGSTSCSSEGAPDAAEQRQRTGTLTLPLTTTSAAGATYILANASFVVRDADGSPVLTLSTEDEDPGAGTISADLEVGAYTVELLEGWALRRIVDGEPRVVEATLSSAAVVEVSITEESESTVLFAFVVGPDGTTEPRGSLGIEIAVSEGASCGNGVVDDGEACDDGAETGSPDQCDWSCAFVCEGACPLRVDPAAADSGDGTSWASAYVSVPAAIAQQFALGGGDVWVRGPGPYERLAGDPEVTLLALREGVRVIGGFSGTERQLAERDPDAQTTIEGAESDEGTAPLIVGASGSWLEGFRVSGHAGTVLVYRDARAFNVQSFTISNSWHYDAHLIELTDSAGSFERLRVEDSAGIEGVSGMRLERSHAMIANSELTRLQSLYSVAGILAVDDSKLGLDDVWFVDNDASGLADTAGVRLADSVALAVDSVWLRNRGAGPTLGASNSRFVAVSSHWEDNSGETSAMIFSGDGAASLVNSSFVGNRAPTSGVVLTRGVPLEVVSSTFLNNDVTWPAPGDYPHDIGVVEGGSLTLYNSFSNRGDDSVFDPYAGTGNCFVDESAEVDVRTEADYSEVYLTPELGCLDIGDDAAAENALLEARVFAASIGQSLPYETNWWQSTTSVLAFCPDTSPIDAGRHFFAPSCGEL